MVATLDDARALAAVSPVEARILRGPEHPIVLLRRRPRSSLAPSVAPGLDWIGVMLPYAPLHHLLLDTAACPLVMTSGNRSDEPIAMRNDEARERLAGIADFFLLHDREILSRVDDSVVRVVDGAATLLRRSRGYAPLPIHMPIATPVPLKIGRSHV